MKRTTKIIAAIVLIVGGSGAVYAFGKHGHWHMTPEEKVEFVTDRVTDKLELDSAQRQNFTNLAELVADIMVEARANKEQQIAEIEGLISAPNFDQGRALEMVQEKTRMVNEKAPEILASLGIFLDSLNAEQKAEMQSFIEHHREHHRHGHGDRK